MQVYYEKANAKLNLALKIVGKNAKNYHLLDSIFMPIKELYDDITIEFTTNNKISCNSTFPNEICLKAVNEYEKAAKIAISCSINIKKNIPIAAGLGGGSSDAAAVLKILNKHYNLLSENALSECALNIGADVPFFLINQTARCQGVGEQINVLNFPVNLCGIILKPDFPVETAWAYNQIKLTEIKKITNNIEKLITGLEANNFNQIIQNLQNDFEKVVFEKFPIYSVLNSYIEELEDKCWHISGSGSSCFILCKNQEECQRVLKTLTLLCEKEAIFIKSF